MEKVQLQIKYALKNSPFYKKKLNDFASSIENDFTLEKYKNLPFTSKEDLSEHNDAFLAIKRNKIAEYVTTSGTSGSPVTVFLSKKDILRLAKNEYDSLKLMGNSSKDIFQLMTTIDKQFMAGLAYYLGVQKLNAGLIRIGPGVPQLQIDAILKYLPTKIIAVPSFIVALINFAKNNEIDLNKTSVKSIVCIGEPIRNLDFSLNVLGQKITENWDVQLYSTYASTEMGAAFSECSAFNGCHLNEDLLFAEVIKENGEDAKNGEIGEIIVTPLGVTGTPVIRYKTGDLAHVYYGKCSCGKNSLRLGPIVGRKNQMIKYKGTTIYPNSIFEILDQHNEIPIYKIQISKDELENDDITILLPVSIEHLKLELKLQEKFKSKIKVLPKINFIEDDLLLNLVHSKKSRKPTKIEFI